MKTTKQISRFLVAVALTSANTLLGASYEVSHVLDLWTSPGQVIQAVASDRKSASVANVPGTSDYQFAQDITPNIQSGGFLASRSVAANNGYSTATAGAKWNVSAEHWSWPTSKFGPWWGAVDGTHLSGAFGVFGSAQASVSGTSNHEEAWAQASSCATLSYRFGSVAAWGRISWSPWQMDSVGSSANDYMKHDPITLTAVNTTTGAALTNELFRLVLGGSGVTWQTNGLINAAGPEALIDIAIGESGGLVTNGLGVLFAQTDAQGRWQTNWVATGIFEGLASAISTNVGTSNPLSLTTGNEFVFDFQVPNVNGTDIYDLKLDCNMCGQTSIPEPTAGLLLFVGLATHLMCRRLVRKVDSIRMQTTRN